MEFKQECKRVYRKWIMPSIIVGEDGKEIKDHEGMMHYSSNYMDLESFFECGIELDENIILMEGIEIDGIEYYEGDIFEWEGTKHLLLIDKYGSFILKDIRPYCEHLTYRMNQVIEMDIKKLGNNFEIPGLLEEK